jgi:hypothetical protein
MGNFIIVKNLKSDNEFNLYCHLYKIFNLLSKNIIILLYFMLVDRIHQLIHLRKSFCYINQKLF